MELLECKNLTKCFDNKKILDNINLIIPRGKIIGFLGKNGTGKTTLIKIINDLLTIDEEKILINGKEIGPESKRVISYLPERSYLDRNMKVYEIIHFFEDFYDNFDSKKAKKLLKDLDLNLNMKLSNFTFYHFVIRL